MIFNGDISPCPISITKLIAKSSDKGSAPPKSHRAFAPKRAFGKGRIVNYFEDLQPAAVN